MKDRDCATFCRQSCTTVIKISHNIVVCTYRKLTAPELEGKEIQWQRTALFFPSPPSWIIGGMSSPKSTNFLQFPLTAMNCLWSLTSSCGAWDDCVSQTRTNKFCIEYSTFSCFSQSGLFYTSHCFLRLLQYSTVTIFATFRSTTVATAVNINLGSIISNSHWKKSFLIFFLFFCSKVLHNLTVLWVCITTFWTRCLIKCLFSSKNRIIASEIHTVNNSFWILRLESLHLSLTSKHKLVIPKKVDLCYLT